MFLVNCASKPPQQQENICTIFKEKSSWYRLANRSEEKWGAPIHVQMSILRQESSFQNRAKPERTRILDALKNYSSIIQLVDEQNSGSGSHTKAATRIALRKGEINAEQKYEPKEGEVAWIQQESRRISKGLVTIDKELAYEILIGRISMKEAINSYTEKIKNR